MVSTRSRPKAAVVMAFAPVQGGLFQHAAARRRLPIISSTNALLIWFQHAAARRRLCTHTPYKKCTPQFQHAAARRRLRGLHTVRLGEAGFNTQPPEGGWAKCMWLCARLWFQHAAARRRLSLSQKPCSIRFRSPDFAKLPRKARTRV